MTDTAGHRPRGGYESPRLQKLSRTRWIALRAAVAFGDVLSLAVGLTAAALLRFHGSVFTGRGPYSVRWMLLWPWLWWVGFLVLGLYEARRVENPVREVRDVVHGVGLGSGVAVLASFLFGFHLSRGWVVYGWLCTLLSVGIGRRLVRRIVHSLRRRGRLLRRTLIVGADASGSKLLEAVERAPWSGFDVVGFVTAGESSTDGVRVVGDVKELRELVQVFRLSDVLVAPSVAGDDQLGAIVAALDGMPVDIHIAPGIEGFLASRLSVEPLGNSSLIAVERVELKPSARATKRAVDVIVAAGGLLLAAPIVALCALAVRFDSVGPAFFRQRRIGLGGKQFDVYKLRSMVRGADTLRPDVAGRNEADGLLFKVRDDPRITRVGKWLRRFSLDEIPQFMNVLKGDMSLVGPRPPLPEEVAAYDATLSRRLLVKPGITGLWQVNGRHDLTFEDYVRFDLLYVQNWSVALDLYIMARTVPAVFTRRGAY